MRIHFVLCTIYSLFCSTALAADNLEPAHIINTETAQVVELTLTEELAVTPDLDGAGFSFGRIVDIAVDSQDNIWVLDRGFVQVLKLGSNGDLLCTVGRRGEGPGEFNFPMAIAINGRGELLVADVGTITTFDSGGKYQQAFRHGFPDADIGGIRVGLNGDIYITCFAMFGQMIVHQYAPDGTLLRSFGDSYAVGKDVEPQIEEYFAGGDLDIDSVGHLYYTQRTPYRIFRYSANGELELEIERENSFLVQLLPERKPGGVVIFPKYARSEGILVRADGSVLNVVSCPPPPGSSEPGKNVLDLFDVEGRLIGSGEIEQDVHVHCQDSEGRLYARVERGGFPAIARFALSVNN